MPAGLPSTRARHLQHRRGSARSRKEKRAKSSALRASSATVHTSALVSEIKTLPREATTKTALLSKEKGNCRRPEQGAAPRPLAPAGARQGRRSVGAPSPQYIHSNAPAFHPAAPGAFCSEHPSRHATGESSAQRGPAGPSGAAHGGADLLVPPGLSSSLCHRSVRLRIRVTHSHAGKAFAG